MLGLPQREAAFARGDDDGAVTGMRRMLARAMRRRYRPRGPCARARPLRPPHATHSHRPTAAVDADDKNRPLVEDIRLLGRILGDVIREQEGREAFELVEQIRRLSVAYRLKRDASAGRALDNLLKNLSTDQTVERDPRFQLLLAPRQHRRGPPPRAPPRACTSAGHLQEGSLATCFERLAQAGSAPPTSRRRWRTPTSRRC